MNELNEFFKSQIINRNNKKIWNSFYEICFENNIKKFDEFIIKIMEIMKSQNFFMMLIFMKMILLLNLELMFVIKFYVL